MKRNLTSFILVALLAAAALLQATKLVSAAGAAKTGAASAAPARGAATGATHTGYRFNFTTPEQLHQYLRYGDGLPAAVHAHRGGGYRGYPENCLETFEHIMGITPVFIETDPRLTKDGVIVLLHDPTLNRTTNSTGALKDMTLAELDKNVRLKDRFGNVTPFKIPTFDAALQWAKGRTVLMIDHKDAPLDRVVEAIRNQKAQANVIVMAYNLEDGRNILALDPSLTLQVFVKDSATFDALAKSGIPLSNVVAFVGHTLPQDLSVFALLHAHGIKAIIGTSRNVDKQPFSPDNYLSIIKKGADIIEADSAHLAGQALEPLWRGTPGAARFLKTGK